MKQLKHNLMKLAAMLAATVLTMGAAAQEVSLTLGEQSKGLTRDGATRVLGCDGENIVYMTEMGILIPSRAIKSYDLLQKEQGEINYGKVKITGTWDINGAQSFVNDGKLDLLMVDRKNGNLLVTRERRNITTLELDGEPQVIVDFKGEKSDNFFFFSAVSPNGKLLAIATAKLEGGLGAEVKVSLYSTAFEEYWTMEVPAHGFSDMLVNNNGEVVLVGMEEKDRQGTVQVIVADGEKSDFTGFRYDARGTLLEWEPAYYADGRLVMIAAMRDESKTIMRVGGNMDCVDAVTCDLKGESVTVDRHRFSEEELAVMENKKGLKTNYQWINFGNLQQVLSDDEGAYVVIDNQWDTYSQYGHEYRERRGMMVLRVGSDGRFKWVHTERTYTIAGSQMLGWIGYRWVPTSDGIMLAWTTNPKDASRGKEQTVKGVKTLSGKSELSVLTLDREGNAKKSSFDIGKQTLMLYPTPVGENEWLVFVSSKSKGEFGRLKIK